MCDDVINIDVLVIIEIHDASDDQHVQCLNVEGQFPTSVSGAE